MQRFIFPYPGKASGGGDPDKVRADFYLLTGNRLYNTQSRAACLFVTAGAQ